MVMTSDQISALAGGFQAQNIGQMQHAAMISQQVGGQTFGQAAMGGLVNRASAVGGPLMTGGMALAGVDPFSMGLRGAMAGGARFGMAGAVGGGLAAAGAVGAPLMAAQYAWGQLQQGMQQQQQVNSALQQSFQFSNRFGGQGFTPGQGASIGQFLRTQAGNMGPGGEFTTMAELTRMTQMMGQMGMGRGVRDVRQFTERFRSMMKEVKEIATAFNTTLEEAQQIMGSMRQSGIFRGQGQVAQQIRQYALAGGIATQELTSAMNVGSQISRAMGGRGRAGAMGGMRTMGQIGIAQQTGILSEEDIYNQTGLTGAAGRAAMAQQQMQTSARFLRSGLGRRVLASMAGREGMLDEESAETFGAGGVSTGETMGMAGRNLGRVGRANFIRNEGRLRGEVLGRFGGNAGVMAMAGWLESRGMDPMSDRGMIFMQRRLGMGTDELENAMKMYNRTDFLESQRGVSGQQAEQAARISEMRSRGGLKGIKRQFEEARNKVQNYLQQKGADFYSAGSNMLERWANKLTGQFMIDMQENLEPEIAAVRQGGEMGRAIAARRFGLGGGVRGVQGIAEQMRQQMFAGQGERPMSALQAFRQAGDMRRFQQAGYNIRAVNDQQLGQELSRVRGLQAAFQEGAGGQFGAMGEGMATELQEAVAMGGIQGRGTEAASQFIDVLERSGDPRAQFLSLQMGQAGHGQRMRVMGSMMRGAGLGGFGESATGVPQQRAIFDQSRFRTAMDRNMAIGEYMMQGMGTQQQSAFIRQRVAGGMTRGQLINKGVGFLANVGTFGLARAFGFDEDLGRRAQQAYEGDITRSQVDPAEIGRLMMSDDTQERLGDMLSNNKRVADAARQNTIQEMVQLRTRANQTSLSEAENSRLEVNKALVIAQDFARMSEEMGPQRAMETLAANSEARYQQKMSVEQIQRYAGTALGSMADRQRGARRQLFRRAREMGAGEMAMFRKGGMFRRGVMSSEFQDVLESIGERQTMTFRGAEARQAQAAYGGIVGGAMTTPGMTEGPTTISATAGQMFFGGMMRAAALEEQIVETGGGGRNQALLEEAMRAREGARLGLSRMSNTEMRKVAAEARKRGAVGISRQLRGQERLRTRMARAGGGLRGDVTIARQFGVSLDAREMRGMTAEGLSTAITRDLLGGETAGGEMGQKFQQQMQQIVELQRSGKTQEAADRLQVLRASSGGLIRRGAEKKQDEQAAQEDPSFRALGKIEAAVKNIGKDVSGALGKASLKGQFTMTNVQDIVNAVKGE